MTVRHQTSGSSNGAGSPLDPSLTPGELFWVLRERLWPAGTIAGLTKPGADHFELTDTVVSGLLHEFGREREPLAGKPAYNFLSGIVGDGYSPYREIREFWVPYAASFALFESTTQLARINGAKNIAALQKLLDILRKAFENCKQMRLFELGDAWTTSPFQSRFQTPFEVSIRGESLIDHLAFAKHDLAVLLQSMQHVHGPIAHAGTDFFPRAFAAVMALAYVRITGSAPKPSALQRLAEAAWLMIDYNDDRMGQACLVVCSSKTDWNAWLELRQLVLRSTALWDEIIARSPALQSVKDELSSGIENLLYHSNE